MATAVLPIKKRLNTIKRSTYVCLLFNFFSFLLVIVSSHLLTYVSLIREFREALKSRTMRRLDRGTRLNFYERVLTFFLEKSMHTSKWIKEKG